MIQGIDLSNNNGFVDWTKVAASGVKFAYLKASEGLSFDDSRFDSYRQRANEHKIRIGAYHFARPDKNKASAEAHHFARRIGNIGRTDLRPVLDFEKESKLNPAQAVEWARAFNKAFREIRGIWPIFYTDSDFLNKLHPTVAIGSGLWLANYGPNDGHVHTVTTPSPWKKILVHQYTSVGKVPGIKGNVDLNQADNLRSLLAHPIKGLIHGYMI